MRRNVRRGLGRLALALGAVTLIGTAAAPASAQEGAPRLDPRKGKGVTTAPAPSKFNLAASPTLLLNFNSWLCGLQQIGEVCTSSVGSSVGGGGFWPEGTANQYIFNSGLQVAAVIGPDGGPAANDTVATFFFHASASGAGAAVTPIYSSANPADLEAWPQDCYLDNPVFGRVKTLSELDSCVQYWDGDPTASHFTDSRPMGLLVTQHSLLWSFPSNKDIMFFIYKFRNVSNTPEFRARNPGVPAGGWTLTNVHAAFAMDPDVSGGEYDENYATVVPELDLGVAWMSDFEASDFVPYAPNFDAAPGFVGVKFLKSPVHTGTTPRTVTIGNRTTVVQPGEELGMTFFSIFTNGGIMSDASNAQQGYRYLSGNLLATEKNQWCPASPPGMCYVNLQTADDMRFYQSSGPFTLLPGEEQEIVVAYIAGAPVPGTYTKGTVIPVGNVMDETRQIEAVMGRGFNRPGFPSLFANALTAQAIYDANFVLPSSPAAPTVTVIPGDRQNTVLWEGSAVTREDPYCQLASDPEGALYDPNFRCADFEGFRVYRKSNPAAPWTPIAQFDLANGIDEVVTTLSEVETVDGSIIVVRADTARVCPAGTKEQLGLARDFSGCVGETGLQFAIIDRGGEFPAPQNGPGLTNGVRYYYAVTSFDINSPQSGPNTLESARVLSQAASAVPRATAPTVSAATAAVALVGANNTVLDTAATITVNAETGAFSGPMPPTNGLRVTAELVPEMIEQEAVVTVRVDSIVPGAPQVGMPHNYYLTLTAPSGTTPLVLPVTTGYTSVGVNSASTGLDATKTGFVGSVEVLHPDPYLLSNSQRAVVNGAHFDDAPAAAPPSWPRWFVSGAGETADGTAGNQYAWCDPDYHLSYEIMDTYCAAKGKGFAGAVAGYEIAPMISYSTLTSISRGFDGILSGVWRAADIEVTWGANGAVTSVMDLTHGVPVPFNPGIRASYGFMTPASFTGVTPSLTRDGNNNIITFSDYTCLDPVNQYSIERLYDSAASACQSPVAAKLQQQAELVTVNWPGPGWSTGPWQGTTAPKTGISMYINGQIYHFIGNSLPAAGTRWTLRTHAGYISADQEVVGDEVVDYDNNVFHGTVRPPTVPGLVARVTLTPGVIADVTDADMERVHTVPDPYYVTNRLENTSAVKRLQFVNLPTEAVVRIYSLSGVLLAVLDHNDPAGGGTLEWDLRTRNNQFVASGVYFFHVEAPNGKTKVGKFTIVQYAQ